MHTIKKDISEFNPDDWAILLMTTAIFLPHLWFIIVLILVEVYLLKKRNLAYYVETQPCWKVIYGFLALEALITTFYMNYWGLAITLGMFGMFVYIAFYQRKIHPKLFQYMIEWAILLNFITGIGALFQFAAISHANGYSFFAFHIFDSPKRRICTTFQNANIYAMMIDMILACILYRFLQTKNKKLKIWYIFLGLFNFGIVLLTGCRSALVPLIFVIPVLLWYAQDKKLLVAYFICLAAVFVLICIHPAIIPRFDDMSTITARFTIWSMAWDGFKKYPLFGNGPWTFHRLHPMFHGHIGSHAHNIYIDCLLSYGVIGTIFVIMYLKYLWSQIKSMKKENKLLYGLMIGVLLIIAIMGLVDGTVEPLKNSIFFMMIFNTGTMYLNQQRKMC